MKSNVMNVVVSTALLLASVFVTASVSAETELCDREIEGVTVRMSAAQARAIWMAKGYFEITSAAQTRGGTAYQSNVQEVAFTNHRTQPNEGYVPGRVSLLLTITELEVNLSKQFHDENGAVARERIAEFCPDGAPARGAKLSCLGVRNGAPSGGRLNITVDPESPETAGRCVYKYSDAGLVHESVRLSHEADAEDAPRSFEGRQSR